VSQNVPTTFQVDFADNLRLALQQTKSKLWDYVPEKGGTGAELLQLDDIIANVKSMKYSQDGRHGDVQYANTGHDNLFIGKPDPDYYAELVDRNDQVQTKIQLQSGYMMTAVATINRAKDDAVLGGFFGTMLTGKYNNLTTNAFPGANVIANDVGGVSGTATGLNVAKVKAAAKLLGQNFNDAEEPAYMPVTADDKDQLLNELQMINADFGATGAELRDGKLRRLMGFEFIEIETENTLFWNAGLLDAGGGVRKTPFWKKSGLARHTWWDQFTDIGPIRQKKMSIQIYADWCGGVTRTDNGKVGYVLNKRN
jgi:hypothetical protein